MALNIVILMGRLVADPELRQTSNGISVCSFTVAVDRSRSKDEKQTDFIDIVAWRQSAEFVSKYFSKGKMIIVEGSIQTRTYEDKNGNKRKAVEVVADNMQFGESKKSSETAGVQPPAEQSASTPPTVAPANVNVDFTEVDGDSEDLPF